MSEGEIVRDTRDLRAGYEALCTRIGRCITQHHVHEFMSRIILIETRIGTGGGVIGEILRQCQVRLFQCGTGLLELDVQTRAQERQRDESDYENDGENRQSHENRLRYRRSIQQHRISRAMSGTTPRESRGSETWQAQLQRDPGPQEPYESALHQRLRVPTESQRRERLRHEFQECMSECAMNMQQIRQEMQSRGQVLDRLFHIVHNVVMEKLDDFHHNFSKVSGQMSKVTSETDRRSHEMCNSLGHFVTEQNDIRGIVEELARRIDAMQKGTHPAGSRLVAMLPLSKIHLM